jgi:hypothetical protein
LKVSSLPEVFLFAYILVLFQQPFFFSCCNAQGDSRNIVVAFYFGLAAAKKATIELSSPSLLQQAFFFLVEVRKVMAFCFGLATTQKATIELPSPSLLHKLFFRNAKDDDNKVVIAYYFSLATSMKVTT